MNSDRTEGSVELSRRERKFTLVVGALFACVGLYVVNGSAGLEATNWMNMFAASDFVTADSVVDYVSNLMVPIPIGLSLLEIAAYNLFGSTVLVTQVLYQFSLVFSYVLAIFLCLESRRTFLLSAFTGLVFLWCTVIIHHGNPQPYDVIFPVFNLLFVIALKYVCVGDGSSRAATRSLVLCFVAGFSLSMFELLRPFVVYLLPFFVFCAYLNLRRLPLRYFACFLLPVVLFSGSWHGLIAAQHGQLTWSNHTGYNLMRAWPMVELPMLVSETNNQPLAPGRLRNINTQEHFENSRRLQASLTEFVVTNPRESVEHVGYRLYWFLTVPTHLSMNDPTYPELWLYRGLIWLGCLFLLRNIVLLVYYSVKSRSLTRLGEPEYILSCSIVFYIVLLAIGDAGEESRFWISILPLVAAQLTPFGPRQDALPLWSAYESLRQKWREDATHAE